MLPLDLLERETDRDLRITRPVGGVRIGNSHRIKPSPNFVATALQKFHDGECIFYMTAFDPPGDEGLVEIVLHEQLADLRDCDLVRHGLAHWERPFRVDNDWCSPGYLTTRGEAALEAVNKGYVWSVETNGIEQEGTREFYRSALRWAEADGMARLHRLRDPWLADLRACVPKVRKGYSFSPPDDGISIALTRTRYRAHVLKRRLPAAAFEIVKAMNDPAMQDILADMVWVTLAGDFDADLPGWTVPGDIELPRAERAGSGG